MKKVIAVILILALAGFGTVGCGAKEKAGEKVAEKLTEKALEKSGAKDVDIDGDQITLKSEDGQEVSIGGGEWPKSELAKNVPQFKQGKLAATVETANYVMINFKEVKKEDAVAYIEKNKPKFTLDNYSSTYDDTVTWSGKNDTGLQVSLTYSDAGFAIMLYLEEKTTE